MSLLRRAGLGRLAYWAWHSPRARWQKIQAEGGLGEYWRTAACRREMRRAAAALRPGAPISAPTAAVPLYFLTGAQFWDQTAFCLHSLQRRTGRHYSVTLIDDGSLRADHVALLARVAPGLAVDWKTDARARLERELPLRQFPNVHRMWHGLVNFRKLTDPHLGRHGWQLLLDSDMLFQRHPEQLLEWLEAPDAPLAMVDVAENYGYPRALLERLAGATLPAQVNSGVTGLRSEAIDWSRIERWLAAMIADAGTHYYAEQALVAMLLAADGGRQLDASDYRVLPDAAEIAAPAAVMHHYVAESRTALVRQAWRAQLGDR